MKAGPVIAIASLAALGILLAARKAGAATLPRDATVTPPGQVPPVSAVNGQILQTVGKHWVLTNKIAKNGMAANYGWHFKGQAFGGEKFEPTVSLPNVRVIQGVGTKHDAAHADYSQTCVLASQACIYKGENRLLSDLLVDPEASKLLSVEGPLQITRQPGVPQLDAMAIQPSTGIARADVAALPNSIPQREAILLSWVEQGLAEYAWADVVTGDLTFHVFADALMFGGVRVCASATLLQQIADRMSCSLLTPRMADLVFEQASKVILPYPMPAGPLMATTAYMLEESDKISKAAAG
jgi:hypothetical protein